jgi:tRNA modification GTPase
MVIKNGILTAIAGKPNVGKSSLLNALAGRERAIVARLPGTTRDTVEHPVLVGGVLFNLTDTAGIRNARDEIEEMGVRRSKAALSAAQLTLFVLDGAKPLDKDDLDAFSHLSGRAILVLNKSDLGSVLTDAEAKKALGDFPVVRVSALTGKGMDCLREAMAAFAGTDERAAEDLLVTSARHRDLLVSAGGHIEDAIHAMLAGVDMDCVTIDLQSAWDDLGMIVGNTVTEDIIDRIFTKFCLGK